MFLMQTEDTWQCVHSAAPLTHLPLHSNKWPGPQYTNDSELRTAQSHYGTPCTCCFTKLHHPFLGHGIWRVVKSCSASFLKVLLLSHENIANYAYTYITLISNHVIQTCGALAMCKSAKLQKKKSLAEVFPLVGCWPLKMGLTSRPKKSVTNCQSMLHNIPEVKTLFTLQQKPVITQH